MECCMRSFFGAAHVPFRVILIGELYFQFFDIFFAQFFNLPYFFLFFFFKYWNVNGLDIFGSGEFPEY